MGFERGQALMPRFGLVCPIQNRHADLGTLLRELEEEVLAAERAGFDAFFFPEFHQSRAGGVVSPLGIGAWLAARASTIRFGSLVLALPLHDPVRLAEEVVMLDWVSEGRVILGVGSAHMPPDFALYGRPRQQRQSIMDEALDVIDACFASEPFSYGGRHFERTGHVTPRPYTRPRPEIWIGAHGPRGLRRAARRADVWVCDPQRHIDVVASLADRYREAAEEAGRPARVALFREGWIAETRDEAERIWGPHPLKVHRLYFNVGVYLPEFEPWVDKIQGRDDLSLERLGPGRFLFGDPEEVRETARDWFVATGADYLAVRMRHPTGPTHEETLAAIELFGREVITQLGSPPTRASVSADER